MDENWKIVNFEEYCPKCRFKDTKETEDPCNECLGTGGRLYSHKPLRFEEKTSKK